MKLYLVRHGDAVDQSPDALRPLSELGSQEVMRVARQLHIAGVRVGRIWHSGKLRAEQTAALLAKQVGVRNRTERIQGIAPMDSVAEFARDLDVWQEDTMIVGHMPFMARLVTFLLQSGTACDAVDFATGSVACLERTADDCWELQWLLCPSLCPGETQ